jgi:hypothetical protein
MKERSIHHLQPLVKTQLFFISLCEDPISVPLPPLFILSDDTDRTIHRSVGTLPPLAQEIFERVDRQVK